MIGGPLTVGERVVRVAGSTGGYGSNGEGTIVRIIPAHEDKYPVRWIETKAVVAWPAPRRIGGSGTMQTTVALSALARPDEMGACERCGRVRRIVAHGQCGTCIHREERRVNTREMYGHGRRGY